MTLEALSKNALSETDEQTLIANILDATQLSRIRWFHYGVRDIFDLAKSTSFEAEFEGYNLLVFPAGLRVFYQGNFVYEIHKSGALYKIVADAADDYRMALIRTLNASLRG